MKGIKHFYAILLVVLVAGSIFSCAPSEWAVKIDNKYITIKEFTDLYYTQNKILFAKDRAGIDKMAKDLESLSPRQRQYYGQMLDKKLFLESVINQQLVFTKAQDDKEIDQNELKTVLKIFEMKMLSSYFVKEKLSKEVKISIKEVNDFYNKNRRLFRNLPLTDEIVERIKLNIQQKKIEQKSEEYLKKLSDKSKINRSGFKEYIDPKKKNKKGWVVKINNHTVSIEDFENYYYTEHKIYMNMDKKELDKLAKDAKGIILKKYPTIKKENYLQGLVQGFLVYDKAIKELPKEVLVPLQKLIKLRAVNAYYVSVKLKSKIKVDEDTIAKFYAKYKNRAKFLIGKPLNDKTKMYIKRVVMEQKFKYETAKFVRELKDEYQIDRSGFTDYMKKQEKKKEIKKSDTKTDNTKKKTDTKK